MSDQTSNQPVQPTGYSSGAARPSQGGIQVSVPHPTYKHQPFRPLPQPTGQPPYHLSLDDVLAPEQVQAIRNSGQIVFHIGGDTGGVKTPQPQEIVAMHMEEQIDMADAATAPAFFYHLGDVVYYYGEQSEYYSQFYEAYAHYAAPIFAIPGNHDGDVLDKSTPSLTAFVRTFCAATPDYLAEAGDVPRTSMIQPNVYWTLDAPFVTIIGLYTNVPEGGSLDDTQVNWLVSELRNAPREKAVILAAHHPVYSADAHHGGSAYMGQVISYAVNQSGRMPDMVFAGHIHNYQRFTRAVEGWEVPYIVAGASGYWHLHYMAKQPDGSKVQPPLAMPNSDVTLENFCEDRHGFMRLTVSPQKMTGDYFTVARPYESWRGPAALLETFTLDHNAHKLVR